MSMLLPLKCSLLSVRFNCLILMSRSQTGAVLHNTEMSIHKYLTVAQPRELSFMGLAFDNVKHLCYTVTGYASVSINP
jgi:hypothetical protein